MSLYFTYSPLTPNTVARAADVNARFNAVSTGFDLLPTPTLINEGRVTFANDTGVANALVVAPTTPITAYTAGLSIRTKVVATNTGTATINVSGLGVKAIKRADGSPLLAGDLLAGQMVTLDYDGMDFRQSIAVASDISGAGIVARLAGMALGTGNLTVTGDLSVTGSSFLDGRFRVGWDGNWAWRPGTAAPGVVIPNAVTADGALGTTSAMLFIRNSATAGQRLLLGLSQNTTQGVHGAVSATTNQVGGLDFVASDGTDLRSVASVFGYVNNLTVGASGYEGRLEFSVGNVGSGTLTSFATLTATAFNITPVINANGGLAVTGAVSATGNVTTGGGVTFPATQVASADPNTLDDYEEGTFTPGVTFGGAAVGLTMSQQFGRYTKIGRMVFIEIQIVMTAKGTSVGNAALTGLPFAIAASTPRVAGAFLATLLTTVSVPMFLGDGGAATLSLNDFSGGSYAPLNNADFQDGTQIYLSATYTV